MRGTTTILVYGPCINTDHPRLWVELRAGAHWTRAPWLIGGDFNVTRFVGERRGPELLLSSMIDFNDLILDLSLIEPPLFGRRFTWSNDQLFLSCVKLDLFLYSPNWEDLFPLSSTRALPRPLSDHIPLILNTNTSMSKLPVLIRKYVDFPPPNFDHDILLLVHTKPN